MIGPSRHIQRHVDEPVGVSRHNRTPGKVHHGGADPSTEELSRRVQVSLLALKNVTFGVHHSRKVNLKKVSDFAIQVVLYLLKKLGTCVSNLQITLEEQFLESNTSGME